MTGDRIFWDNKNGKQVLIMDCTGLNNDQIKQLIPGSLKFYENKEPKSMRTLTDLTNTYLTKSTYDAFKDLDAKTNPYDLKSAVVGLNKAKRILLNMLNKFNSSDVKGFNSREEAMAWLTE